MKKIIKIFINWCNKNNIFNPPYIFKIHGRYYLTIPPFVIGCIMLYFAEDNVSYIIGTFMIMFATWVTIDTIIKQKFYNIIYNIKGNKNADS